MMDYIDKLFENLPEDKDRRRPFIVGNDDLQGSFSHCVEICSEGKLYPYGRTDKEFTVDERIDLSHLLDEFPNVLAFYKSKRYIDHGPFPGKWGIFILTDGVQLLFEKARDEGFNLSHQEIADILYQHEVFHFYMDLNAASFEIQNQTAWYTRHHWLPSEDNVEEALANKYALKCAKLRKNKDIAEFFKLDMQLQMGQYARFDTSLDALRKEWIYQFTHSPNSAYSGFPSVFMDAQKIDLLLERNNPNDKLLTLYPWVSVTHPEKKNLCPVYYSTLPYIHSEESPSLLHFCSGNHHRVDPTVDVSDDVMHKQIMKYIKPDKWMKFLPKLYHGNLRGLDFKPFTENSTPRQKQLQQEYRGKTVWSTRYNLHYRIHLENTSGNHWSVLKFGTHTDLGHDS